MLRHYYGPSHWIINSTARRVTVKWILRNHQILSCIDGWRIFSCRIFASPSPLLFSLSSSAFVFWVETCIYGFVIAPVSPAPQGKEPAIDEGEELVTAGMPEAALTQCSRINKKAFCRSWKLGISMAYENILAIKSAYCAMQMGGT